MAGFYRDMAILALAIVAGVIWSLYSLVTRRGHRLREKQQREVLAAQQAKQAPIPGMTEYAASQGWTGPATDPGAETKGMGDYVQEMMGNLSGNPRSVRSDTDIRVSGPLWGNLHSGSSNGRKLMVGNVWMGFGSEDCAGSVCVLHLNEMLPPLFVNLRRRQPYIRFGMKEMSFESEAFNRRFSVLALNREYAMDVITERTMEILMEREDWVFYLEFDRIVCLAMSSLESPQDYAARVDAVTRFAALIPHFVEQDRAAQMPTLPDGTVIDLTDPSSREKVEAAFAKMSPQQQQELMAQARTQGARFIAGMFGKDLPPEVLERLSRPPQDS